MVCSSSTDRWDVFAKTYLLEDIMGLWATGKQSDPQFLRIVQVLH